MTICLSVSSSFSQLPNGSIAPDWTLTDLNGTTHNLYSYLDNGYTVFIDFSAVWCPPCWSYHTSGALEDLYINHGPDGMPNVSSTTTDDVMVFFIEGDQGTVAELNGTGSNTQGNWVAGTPYPIFCTDGTVNTNAVTSAYSIGYWPTLYRICPDRICDEVGQPSNPYSLVSSCPPPTTNTNDVRAMTYEGGTETCLGDLTPEIKVQNYGLNALTSFDIEVLVNGTQNSITPWTGNLTTYQLTSITLPTITGITGTSQIEIKTTNPNGGPDDDMSNNDISFTATLSYQTAHIDVTVNITTDQYPDETTWDIKTISGLTVANGGPYSVANQPQTPVNVTLSLDECYIFTIYDAYGDGLCCSYGNGGYSVTDGNSYTLASGGYTTASFSDEESSQFKTDASPPPPASWDCDGQGNCTDPGTGNGAYSSYTQCMAACTSTSVENEDRKDISIYPNPVKGTLNIKGIFESVNIYDMFGRLVLTSTNDRINTSDLADGVYVVNINTNNNIIVTKRITVAK